MPNLPRRQVPDVVARGEGDEPFNGHGIVHHVVRHVDHRAAVGAGASVMSDTLRRVRSHCRPLTAAFVQGVRHPVFLVAGYLLEDHAATAGHR